MSRDFDKAQEMVLASMEYVKVLGFRIRRTEVQRDDWKQVAQSHADELIKLRQHVDALKAERDAAKQEAMSARQDAVTLAQALGIAAAKEAGKLLGMVAGEGLRGAAERVIKERDALRAECDDLRRVFSLVHGSLGIQQGEHIGNAIDALKKERDCANAERARHEAQSRSLVADVLRLTAEIERLKNPARQHPVKVGESVRRTTEGSIAPIGTLGRVLVVWSDAYQVALRKGFSTMWAFDDCTPCDPPPEASHITPEGKQTAEGAVEPKPGDVVRLEEDK